MIELYVFPPSPRAFKVMAIANHLGIETKILPLDLVKGEQKTSEYAALNPNMRMPTMKDGDYVLWESCAIEQYLADKKPDSGLFPKDQRARLDVTRWQFWETAHWDPACAVFLYENLIKPVILKIVDKDIGPGPRVDAFEVIGGVAKLAAGLGLAAGAAQPDAVEELGTGLFEGRLGQAQRRQVVRAHERRRRRLLR